MVTPRTTRKNNRFKTNNIKAGKTHQSFETLTLSLALQLAAPHTWAAAIVPVLVSGAYVGAAYSGNINIVVFFVLLAICILMQSAVNTLNDYFDYKKGTDSLENSSQDEFDAVLVYHHLNPRHVLALAITFLAIALLLGCYIIYVSDFVPLIIGIILIFVGRKSAARLCLP